MAINKGKKGKLEASLFGISDANFEERISIPFPLDEIQKLKIGQEVKITISGCVKLLEGDDFHSSVSLEVYDKSLRKTSNTQSEGIRDLSDEEGGEY